MRLLLVNGDIIYRNAGRFFTKRAWPTAAMHVLDAAGDGNLFAPLAELPDAECSALTRLHSAAGRIIASPFVGGSTRELKMRLAGCSYSWRRTLTRVISEHDLVLQRIPSPYLRYVAGACGAARKPLVLLVSGPRVDASIGIHRVPKVIRPAARAYLRWQDREQKQVARDAAAVLVVGSALAHEWAPFGNVIEWTDDYLPPESFHRREDTCTRETIRIVRACDLSVPRGVELLLEALRVLGERGVDVELDLLGDGEPTYVEHLKSLACGLGIRERVLFHGWQNRAGVLRFMRNADLHVITSLADGVPRVIREGGANCLPLVTTGAGGIPTAVKDGHSALLIGSRTPGAVADAVTQVINNAALRRRLIAQGYEDALSYRADRRARQLVSLITEQVDYGPLTPGGAALSNPAAGR